MDCCSNTPGSRSDCPQNRRSRTCRQNSSFSRQNMTGNYHMSMSSGYDNMMSRGGCSRQTGAFSGCRECPRSERTSRECPCSERSLRQCPCSECRHDECSCPSDVLRATERMPVGMTYTPYQEFTNLYEWDTAFCQGTLFCDLDKPFLMTNCIQGGVCR